MIYYIETNIVAIIIGIILLVLGHKRDSRKETSQILMDYMLLILILFGVSDIAAYCFRGRNLFGIELTNIVYFIALAVGSYAWFLYILVKMGYARQLRRLILLTGGPLLILCIALIINPATEFFFSVDEELIYHRGPGLVVTWIVEWGYMIAAFIINVIAIHKEQRSYKRSEYKGYLLFMIPMAAAAICQMLFYGTTTTQIGFAISMLMAYINNQYYQVQRDDLTGLNNKNAFLSFRDAVANRNRTGELTLFMMDVDNFKSINDTYGHLIGDKALRDVADVLTDAGDDFGQHRMTLFRFAGDEFVVIGTDLKEEEKLGFQKIVNRILEDKNEINKTDGEKYTLALSMGWAAMKCQDAESLDILLKNADEAMYRVKEEKKKYLAVNR